MDAAAETHKGRGNERILAHCSALDGAQRDVAPARMRLEHVLGYDLARLLVGALARGHRPRVREVA